MKSYSPDAAPDYVKHEDNGRKTFFWFRERNDPAPRKYDVSVPDKKKKRGVIYILYITSIICLIMCSLGYIIRLIGGGL